MPPRKNKKTTIEAHTIEELLEKNKDILKRGSSEDFSYSRIPFGLPALDDLIGGGIAKKRISIFAGPSNVGKSYLAGQAVKSVQEYGGTTAWIDTEMSWDSEWMKKCGIDVDNILIAQPGTGEEAFDLMKSLMQDGIDLIVLDSISGLVPTNMAEEEDFSFNPMAWQARFVNQSFPRIMPSLKYGSAVIFINQLRQSIGNVTFIDSLPGGKAQTFFSHLILQIRRSGWIEEPKGNKIGFDVEITNRKTKSGGRSQGNCTIPFRFDGGFDILESYIREAIKYDIVVKKGAWYRIDGVEENLQGMNGVRDYLTNNPSKLEELINRVNSKDEDFTITPEIEIEVNEEIEINAS